MRPKSRSRKSIILSFMCTSLLAFLMAAGAAIHPSNAAFPWFKRGHRHAWGATSCPTCAPSVGEGAWYWVRSPEQEQQAVMALYIRYCIRCHGVDGRGVWDIPGVPNFADAHWQAMRPDASLARSILEGRGAVMPPFRGALTLEEAYAMARHLRTFVPGTEMGRPDRMPADSPPATKPEANPRVPGTQPTAPSANSPGPFAR
jgi:mono/diheme cytochrome c family protein